jgi:hypothetical protein
MACQPFQWLEVGATRPRLHHSVGDVLDVVPGQVPHRSEAAMDEPPEQCGTDVPLVAEQPGTPLLDHDQAVDPECTLLRGEQWTVLNQPDVGDAADVVTVTIQDAVSEQIIQSHRRLQGCGR